ncbi:MAG: GAF domain-containing protein, partial [Thermostichus sp. DG02_5_bins_236]
QAEEARKQAERTLRLQAARDHVLGRMTERIRHSLDLMEILQTAVTEIRQLLQADRVVIYRLRPDGRGFIQVESVSQAEFSLLTEGITEGIVDLQLDTLAKNSFARGQVQSISDVEEDPVPPSCVAHLRSLQVRANLTVPIWQDRHPELEKGDGEYLWGLLAVDQCRGPRRWQDWEKSILMQLSPQLSIALQQARLYQQLRNLNNDLEVQVELRTAKLQQSLHFEEFLRSISNKVVASLDETEILNSIVQDTMVSLGLLGCKVGFLSDDFSTFIPRYVCSQISPSVVGRSYPIREMGDFLLNSLKQGQAIQRCFYDSIDSLWVTLLNCPILDEGELLGALSVERPPEQIFLEAEIQLVQQVANLCALAIRQARLYEAAQAQVTELERLNLLKDDFISTVSHELRTPMTNVRMALRMMQITNNREKQQRYFTTALQECDRQIALINDLLDMQRLEVEGYSLNPQEIHLVRYLPELLSGIQPLAQSKNQHLQLHMAEGIPTLWADSISLSRILRELLHNAVKYTAPEGAIHLRLTSDQQGILFTLSNSTEISKAELSRIFDKFYRIPQSDRWKHGGTGLGLALVKKLVMEIGGNISVTSLEGWTHFRVWLPIRLKTTSAPLTTNP